MKIGWMSARNIKMQEDYDCWDNTVAASYGYNVAEQQTGYLYFIAFLDFQSGQFLLRKF